MQMRPQIIVMIESACAGRALNRDISETYIIGSMRIRVLNDKPVRQSRQSARELAVARCEVHRCSGKRKILGLYVIYQ